MQQDNDVSDLKPTGSKLKLQTQTDSLKQNIKGIFIIARTDMIAHLKSPRMAVLMIIFVLAVFGGAYVFAGLAVSSSEIQPPEFLVWTFIVDYDDGANPDDALIITTDTDGRPVGDVEISMFNLNGTPVRSERTDANGRAVFFNLSIDDFQNFINSEKGDYRNPYRPLIISLTQVSQVQGELQLYTQVQATDLDKDNVRDDVAVIVLDSELLPLANVKITPKFDNNPVIYTNGYGISKDFNLLKGKYDYDIESNDIIIKEQLEIQSDDTDIENLLQLKGPDDVLMQVAGLFMGMVIPIIAIGISFDSISREKISRSIIFLLSRPIGKRSIALGKFMGSLIAISIPLTLVSLIAVGIISSVTSESPSAGFVAGFIVVTIAFLTLFILLQQIFSTLARTTGTAILAGLGIWLFFYMFFGLIILGINAAMGNQLYSQQYFEVANVMSLLSPNGIYSFMINAISPTTGGAPIGIPEWAPFASFFIWFFLLFAGTIEIFRKRPFL
jgi:ABC-type transport system involved in multi-copper enzyme maturation permease subunit